MKLNSGRIALWLIAILTWNLVVVKKKLQHQIDKLNERVTILEQGAKQ